MEPRRAGRGAGSERAARLRSLFNLRHGRAAGLGVLVLLLLGGILGSGHLHYGEAVFDRFQRLHPRPVDTFPVAIVEIDEASLQRHGQWPWPRTLLATLLQKIAAGEPLATGFDILFAEPDRNSAAAFVRANPTLPENLRAPIAALADPDEVFAQAIARAPVVTGRAAVRGAEARAWLNASISAAPVNSETDSTAALPQADALIHARAPLEQAARGFGVLTVPPDRDGVTRRVALFWSIAGTPAPVLALEVLRVGLGANWSSLLGGGGKMHAVQIADAIFETKDDGTVRPWFSSGLEARYISAAEVLDGSVDSAIFRDRLVLVGVTGVGTLDRAMTPLGPMNGIEVHAQTIENLIAGTLLHRPEGAVVTELIFAAIAGLLLIALMPRLTPVRAAVLALLLALLALLLSYLLFRAQRLLYDPIFPALTVAAVYSTLMVSLWSASMRQRRSLALTLQQERLDAARVAGELQAARDIQLALLPDPRTLALPATVSAHALLEPAREVGGDLYELHMLDATHLFFLVGDVTGKGVPAALFMAISKALCKSAMLRAPNTPEQVLAIANLEISRDNPASLFVTAFLGVLDCSTGELEFCNAGNENPLIVATDGSNRVLECDGGPPLCVMEDFPYPLERTRLEPGEILLLFTDGLTEARGSSGKLFGQQGLAQALASDPAGRGPEALLTALRDAVRAHEAGAQATDDLTLMAIRFEGTSGQ